MWGEVVCRWCEERWCVGGVRRGGEGEVLVDWLCWSAVGNYVTPADTVAAEVTSRSRSGARAGAGKEQEQEHDTLMLAQLFRTLRTRQLLQRLVVFAYSVRARSEFLKKLTNMNTHVFKRTRYCPRQDKFCFNCFCISFILSIFYCYIMTYYEIIQN